MTHEIKSGDAVMTGQAARIPAALKASEAQMTAQVQIIRAGTGKVEDYTLTFTPLPDNEQPKEP